MALGEASVRILPDASDFEKNLLAAVQSAMSAAQSAVDEATAGIGGAFDGAAAQADAALSTIDGEGFAGATASADAAAGEITGSLDGAASEADAALASVDGDGFTGATNAAQQASSEVSGSFEKASDVASRALGDIDFSNLTKGVGSFAAVTMAVRGFINEAEQGQKAEARIRQIATSMNLFGDNVGAVTSRLEEYAVATARATGVDDDSIMATQAKLLTFRELAKSADEVGGSFDRATMAAIDLAAAGFGSAESNAVQLGKALQDPIKGITALARAGVTFTAAEKERIRVLVESNQIGEAQRLVLASIEQQVGGTGEATATASEKMRVAFALTQEEIGNALLPAMTMVADVTMSVLGAFNALPEPVRNVITVVGVAGTAFYAASRTLQGLGVAAGTANKALGAVGLVLGAGIAIYQIYNRRKQEAAERTQTFADALLAERDGQNDAVQAAIARTLADENLLAIGEKLNVNQRDLANAIKGEMGPALADQVARIKDILNNYNVFGEENRKLREEFGLSRDEAQRFVNVLDEQAAAYAAATVQVEAQIAAEQALVSISGDAATAQARLSGLTREYEQASLDAMRGTDEFTGALSEEEQAALDAEAALRTLLDATLSMFNTQLQLEDATYRTNDSIGEYTTVLADVESGALKGEEATRKLAEAQSQAASDALSQAATNAKLAEEMALASGASFTAADSYRVQRDALQTVADSLDPNSPLRKQLLGYIDQLNNRIPREVATRITASLKVQPLDITTRRLMEGGIPYNPNTAEGGVFASAQTRTIAEAGAEAVIPIGRPARAMELMELSGLADMVRGSGGGAMVNIQQATFASATDADLVAQRLNTALRVRSFAG